MASRIVSTLLGGGIEGAGKGISMVINSIKGRNPEDAAKLEQIKAETEQLQEKYAADFALAGLQGQIDLVKGQLDINKNEASSGSTFVAGWRPFIGWVCGAGLASDIILRPFVIWIVNLCGKHADYPQLDMATLLPVLLGMLGLAAARSYDKTQGTSNGH